MKTTHAREIEILRFFETESLDVVELLYSLITEKINQRLRNEGGANPASSVRRRARRTSPTLSDVSASSSTNELER